jgi:hypothetical protein
MEGAAKGRGALRAGMKVKNDLRKCRLCWSQRPRSWQNALCYSCMVIVADAFELWRGRPCRDFQEL